MTTSFDDNVIDAGAAPDLANQTLAAALASDSDEVVDIAEAPDTTVKLPGGFFDTDGNLVTTAEVRELNGEDEEALGKAANSGQMIRVVNAILARGVLLVGNEPSSPKLLNRLLIGDRDALLLGVRRATYGNILDLEVRCPACTNTMEVGVDLTKDVPVRELESPQVSYRVELRDGYAEVSLPTGFAQQEIADAKVNTAAEINTLLLSNCVESINGSPVVGTGPVRRLGMKDRKTLLEFITKTQPGPQYDDVKVECDQCSRDIPLPIDIGDLFRG